MTPEQITAYTTALVTLITAITTLVMTIRNGKIAAQTHAMVKADATPEALLSVAVPPVAKP